MKKYSETYHYDANGNITQLTRKDQNGLTIDNLTYRYNFDATTSQLSNNHLRGVAAITPNGTANYDIDNQTATDNYSYGNIGNLTKEGIDKVDWTVYGKVRQVTKSNGNWLQYRYDATGNRISKTEGTVGNRPLRTQYYVQDASGNVMAIYEQKEKLTTPPSGVGGLSLIEQPMYGSSRLGTYNGQTARGTQTLGNKHFEISNHLGNVLLTFTDNKYQDLKINSATDYYPFGMTMKGREFQAGKYRYGFNTQEKDNSINPNHYTAMYWEYDGRIGRRWNLDPVPQISISDYAVNGNNPIFYRDVLGDDKNNDYILNDDGTWKLLKKTHTNHRFFIKTNGGKYTHTFVVDGVKGRYFQVKIGTPNQVFILEALSKNKNLLIDMAYQKGGTAYKGSKGQTLDSYETALGIHNSQRIKNTFNNAVIEYFTGRALVQGYAQATEWVKKSYWKVDEKYSQKITDLADYLEKVGLRNLENKLH